MSSPRNPKGRAKLGCLPLGNPQVCLLNEVKEVNVSSQLTSLTSMESVRAGAPVAIAGLALGAAAIGPRVGRQLIPAVTL